MRDRNGRSSRLLVTIEKWKARIIRIYESVVSIIVLMVMIVDGGYQVKGGRNTIPEAIYMLNSTYVIKLWKSIIRALKGNLNLKFQQSKMFHLSVLIHNGSKNKNSTTSTHTHIYNEEGNQIQELWVRVTQVSSASFLIFLRIFKIKINESISRSVEMNDRRTTSSH